MVTAQTYEIALMQDMLEERGFAPAPDETEGEMDMGQEHP
jgi:hypothetical protein